MKKLNNKGFMLVELLVVTIAILVIFTAIYQNYFPAVGEYESRMSYANIDSEYATFYTRLMYLKMFNNNETIEKEFFNTYYPSNTKYVKLVENGICSKYNFTDDFVNKCNSLVSMYKINEVILTNYDTTNIKNSGSLTNMEKYINYLPKYTLNTSEKENIVNVNPELYRLVVKTDNGYSNMSFYSSSCEYEYNYSFNDCTSSNTTCIPINQLYVYYSSWNMIDCSSEATDTVKCETVPNLYCMENCDDFKNLTNTDCTSNESCQVFNGPYYRTMTILKTAECPEGKTCSQLQQTSIGYKYKNYLNNNNFSVTSCVEE